MLSSMVPMFTKSNKFVEVINRTINCKMSEMKSVRWALNTSKWQPTNAEVSMASACIQKEEKERISKFVFQNDAKSSLMGRLLMRKFVNYATGKPYSEIRFDRDTSGKPFLCDNRSHNISFNVSHQGDFVVLAGTREYEVGIDVMKIERPVNKNIPEYFRIMNRQFSSLEWSHIKSFSTETEQIAAFYRLWCLKESYVKNIGVGITVNLAEISFKINTPILKIGEICNDTVLYLKGLKLNGWTFEETLLDDKHAVAVALKMDHSIWNPSPYIFLSFEDLMKDAAPFNCPDVAFTNNFLNKELKAF